jgi:hypothetical protein
MPMLIDHIDKIARKKGRGVLYLEFHDTRMLFLKDLDDRTREARDTIIRWLEQSQIPFEPCAGIANPSLIEGYQGQLYIDVPFDPDDGSYRKVAQFLEDDTGNTGATRFPGVRFCFLPQ